MNLKDVISAQALNYDCFYLYDENRIIEDTKRLKRNFPQVDFLYSIKCNSNPFVVRSVFSQGFGADAASLGEVLEASEAGLSKDRIYYSSPGKTLQDIRRAIGKSTIIADSLDEIRRIQAIAAELGACIAIGVRINPEFSFYDSTGHSSKFGIDEKQLYEFMAEHTWENIRVTGIHVHLKSQELNAGILAGYYENVLHLAERFQIINKCRLDYINMGSGIGIPYSSEDEPMDLEVLGGVVQKQLKAFHSLNPDTKILIEVGRYAVGKSGVYVTKVLDRKVSYGKVYIILKNTLNGFARPSLAKLVSKYSPDDSPEACEPLFTSKDAFEIATLKASDAPQEKVTLVGNLCTAADVIAEDIRMPYLEGGDVVIVTNAGSYASVLSPYQFSSQESPAELFLSKDGEVKSQTPEAAEV